jgi:O-antigen/teichoic acid export membrane protein
VSVEPGSEARRYGRAAGLLSVGVGATGLITYLYFAIASHELSRVDYGEVVVLWTAVFITVAMLHRPIEQLLSRTVAEHEAQGRPTGRALRVAATIQLGVSAAFVVLALALRGPLQDDLLSGSETLYWILIGAVTAYGASYFARGFLAGSHRFVLYAILIIAESISRTLFPLAVALGIATGQSAVALGMVAAPVLSLAVVPALFFRRARVQPVRPERSGPEFTLAYGGGFAAAVLFIMLSEQALLNAGPLLINSTSGAALAGFMFNILMIARAPIQLFQAVTTSLLPHLTRLRSDGSGEGEEAFRLSVRVTIRGIVGFAAVVALAVLIAGPELMHLAFGEKFEYERVDLLIVTAGMGLYLTASTFNQAALAQGQVRRASMCWVGSAVAFVLWCLLPVLEEVRRVEVGYLGASTLLCVLLYAVYRSPRPRPEDELEPGSPRELEAQLAAADEGT